MGDPLSAYAFLVAIELLNIRLLTEPRIGRVRIHGLTELLQGYADDLTLILPRNAAQINLALSIIRSFGAFSGLVLNAAKTVAVNIGPNRDARPAITENVNWADSFKLLGVSFNNSCTYVQGNYDSKLTPIYDLLNKWKGRLCSPCGRIIFVKTFVLSKINHLILTLPNPSHDSMTRLQTAISDFIWDGKSRKVAFGIAQLPKRFGGLCEPSIADFCAEIRLGWLNRAERSSDLWARLLFQRLNATGITQSPCELSYSQALAAAGAMQQQPFWKTTFERMAETMRLFYDNAEARRPHADIDLLLPTFAGRNAGAQRLTSVSYTHLTLPTIYSV